MRDLYRLFADLLEYPREGLGGSARECATLLAPRHPEAAARVGELAAFAELAPRGRLEEAYTETFDLNAACHPYVGYHLFGESYKRSALLVGLRQRYRACGVEIGNELPDHVVMVLRFLSAQDDADLARELIGDALLPALERMVAKTAEPAADGAPPPDAAGDWEIYRGVLDALRAVLQQQLDGTSDGQAREGIPAGSGAAPDA